MLITYQRLVNQTVFSIKEKKKPRPWGVMSPCFVIRGVLNPFIRYSHNMTCEHLGWSLVLVGCLLTRASTNRDNTSFLLLLFSQTWRRAVHHYIWKKTKLFAQWLVLSIKTSYISLPSVPLNCVYLHRSYYVIF